MGQVCSVILNPMPMLLREVLRKISYLAPRALESLTLIGGGPLFTDDADIERLADRFLTLRVITLGKKRVF